MLSKFEKQSNKLYHAKYKMQILRGKACCFVFFPQKNYLLIMKRKLCFERRSLFFWVTEIGEIIGFRVSFVRKLKNQFI